jgi:hypothetical protein
MLATLSRPDQRRLAVTDGVSGSDNHANPLWGAPRIHGELLKLGIEVTQATVAKDLARRGGPPSQSWRTFLANHVSQLASIDFFTVPTATFRVLFVFVVLSHDRRHIVHINVTSHRRRCGRRSSSARRGRGMLLRASSSAIGMRCTDRILSVR